MMAGGGDDGRGCRGKDMKEDAYIELFEAGSSPAQLSFLSSVMFELEGLVNYLQSGRFEEPL
jgi:hypothetical protein